MAKRKCPDGETTGDEDRVMLITGASSGLGENLVKHFTGQGWHVAALARNSSKLTKVCGSAGPLAHAYACDVSDRAAVEATIGQVLKTHHHIDVCINNAAVAHDGKPFWELPISDIDKLVDVNLKGAMYVTHLVVKDMVKRNSGFIIAVSSVAGTRGIPNESCYVASKHGLNGFMDTLANDLQKTNVRVSTICPGGIDTPWWRDDHPYGEDKTHSAGTTNHLIQTQELVDLIEFQIKQPVNRVFKRVVMFPKTENH